MTLMVLVAVRLASLTFRIRHCVSFGVSLTSQLLIYTWGLAVIRAGQLPTGAEDSQATYDASVLTARKHGVTGRAQLANMNGFDPVLQEVLCALPSEATGEPCGQGQSSQDFCICR